MARADRQDLLHQLALAGLVGGTAWAAWRALQAGGASFDLGAPIDLNPWFNPGQTDPFSSNAGPGVTTTAPPIGVSPAASAPPAAGLPAVLQAVKGLFQPRGIRNNNPMNIEWSSDNNWVGQTGSDGRFAKFDTPGHGLRAAFHLLRTYSGKGLTSFGRMIAYYAPAPENDPVKYAADVQRLTGISSAAALNVNDAATMIPVMRGIIAVENGGPAWFNYYSAPEMLAAFQAA